MPTKSRSVVTRRLVATSTSTSISTTRATRFQSRPTELRAEKNGQRESRSLARAAAENGQPGEAPVRAGTSSPVVAAFRTARSPLRPGAGGGNDHLLNRGQPLAQQIFPAVFLIAFFIPFSYFTDSFAYRLFRSA